MLLRRFVPAEDSRAYSIDHWRGTQCCCKDLSLLKICAHIEEECNFAAKICVCKRFVCTLTRNAILCQRFVFAKDLRAYSLDHWRGTQFCCKDLCLRKICVLYSIDRWRGTQCCCEDLRVIFNRSLNRNAMLLRRFVWWIDN